MDLTSGFCYTLRTIKTVRYPTAPPLPRPGGIPVRRLIQLPLILLLIAAGPVPGRCQTENPTPSQVRKAFGPFVRPLTLQPGTNPPPRPEVIQLGRTLYYDRRLSLTRDKSCNDCHDLANYGSNGSAVEQLRTRNLLRRDVPSTYNLGGLNLLYWDGRAASLESQTATALLAPSEMAMPDTNAVMTRLGEIPGYETLFQAAWPGTESPVTFAHLLEAISQFERGLVTPAPFDRFLEGDDTALSPDQLAGALLFEKNECAACHTGSTLGGQMLQKLGVLVPWPNQTDAGYFEVSRQPAHRMFFRVQGLRNVEKTAPYFHDGSSRTLQRAIQQMAFHERGRRLGLTDLILIEEFLNSLTGILPLEYIRPPAPP